MVAVADDSGPVNRRDGSRCELVASCANHDSIVYRDRTAVCQVLRGYASRV
jgi:hypothetical protein